MKTRLICLLVLFLFLLPLFVQKNFGIELPGTLEIIILLFIFASEILGELELLFHQCPQLGFHPPHNDGFSVRSVRLCTHRYSEPE